MTFIDKSFSVELKLLSDVLYRELVLIPCYYLHKCLKRTYTECLKCFRLLAFSDDEVLLSIALKVLKEIKMKSQDLPSPISLSLISAYLCHWPCKKVFHHSFHDKNPCLHIHKIIQYYYWKCESQDQGKHLSSTQRTDESVSSASSCVIYKRWCSKHLRNLRSERCCVNSHWLKTHLSFEQTMNKKINHENKMYVWTPH